MPSLLFINRVYPPDGGATGRVLEQVAVTLARSGWDVTVLAKAVGSPKYEFRDGVRVVRVGTFFSKSSLLVRSAGYAMMIPSLLCRALSLPRADVVVTMTDPPMLSTIAPFLSFLKGSRLVHWVQDLYPEVAEEAGVLERSSFPARVIRFLSERTLRSYDLVVAVGRCMAQRLCFKGVSPERVILIPNIGMEKDIVPYGSLENPFRIRYGIPSDDLVVMYSGNLGRAHEFETVLEAARLLRDEGEKGILFLFVGEGPSRSTVERIAAERELTNVRLLPSQPGVMLSESLGAADLHLVTMRRGMSGLVVPSKFYGVLAAGRPCVFVGSPDSEVARVIRDVGCGKVIDPGDGALLAWVIKTYRRDSVRIFEEGSRGLDWLRLQPDAGAQFLMLCENQKYLFDK